LALPFRDECFDLVSAFDVLEHCEPESGALKEMHRVLAPRGRLLLSVPAYQWAWTDHDVQAGHYRRYTRPRLLAAVEGAGLVVRRCTHGFAGVFPMFAAERVVRRLRRPEPNEGSLPQVSPTLDSLFMKLSRVESRLLRRRDLPFGSSIFLSAEKP
jgi:SAM-dependent methyltransferase